MCELPKKVAILDQVFFCAVFVICVIIFPRNVKLNTNLTLDNGG